LVIATLALVVATGGTAFASGSVASIAKLVGLNHKQQSQVKSIAKAQISSSASTLSVLNATNATNATNAINATNATNASNATTVGGDAPAAFEPSSHFIRSGLITATQGQTVTISTFGPWTLSLVCVNGGTSHTVAEIDAASTVANSDAFGTLLPTPGTPAQIGSSSSTAFDETDDDTWDFLTPNGQDYQGFITFGENWTTANACFADALMVSS
jgi:hypothetical protein